MGKLFTMVRELPMKVKASVAIVAAVVIVPAAVFAWGPGRATFTEANPAPYITFNSITDNKAYGDERNFVTIKDASNTANGGWQDTVTAQPGKEYVVRMFVHNNAASNLNKVAENVKASVSLPTTTSKNVPISGFINSSNANPTQVYDDVNLTSDQNFNLAYVPGSATFHNNSVGVAPQGVGLPDSIVTSAGAQLGYDKLDGKIPGCYQYSGYIYFKVKPQFAPTSTDFTVNKMVRKDGATDGFKESTAVKPGDTVNYRVEVKNTGSTDIKNINVKDQIPAGVTYIPGTAKILNANNSAGAYIQNGDNIVGNGVNIGNYTPGSNAFVVFNAKVKDNDALPLCGPNVITNKASATPEGQTSKEDTADITVNKECQPGKINVCDLSTKKVVSINENEFDSSKYSKNLADCNVAPSSINVCELSTKKIVTIKESDFDSTKYSKTTSDCNATPTTPTTPTELPETGISSSAVVVAGLGLFTAGLGYALTSSRIRKLFIG